MQEEAYYSGESTKKPLGLKAFNWLMKKDKKLLKAWESGMTNTKEDFT